MSTYFEIKDITLFTMTLQHEHRLTYYTVALYIYIAMH